jgi:curli production assembly/transport component CsgG
VNRRSVLAGLLALGGCASTARTFSAAPSLATQTSSLKDLLTLPPPRQRLYVGIFAFLDQTGQHKPANPTQNFADYSFAVTQGATSILINALHDAGAGAWFHVLERNRLPDLMQERQIIRANRIEFPAADGKPMAPLGPLLNAGIILEGGIIGYDSATVTGGIGANYLGIGANTQYSKDTVSIYVRAVSVLTGEILTSVTADKTIYSVSLDGSIFKFVGFNKLLQAEGGFSTNEPVTLCVKQAIELGLYATIMEGALRGLWSFADEARQQQLLDDYAKTRGGIVPAPVAAAAHRP